MRTGRENVRPNSSARAGSPALQPGQRKRVMAIAVVIAGLALAAFLIFRGNLPRAARPTGGETFVAFGDSLVAGQGATAGQDFVSKLSSRVGVPIINAGHNGDTTGAALERLDQDVLSLNPRVVIVLLGGNDFLRGVPREETFRNLGAIVERIRERGSAVILVAVSVGLFSDPNSEQYEKLARQEKAGLVPDILDNIMGHQDRMSDQIHPNDVGYKMMADRIEPLLRDLMSSD